MELSLSLSLLPFFSSSPHELWTLQRKKVTARQLCAGLGKGEGFANLHSWTLSDVLKANVQFAPWIKWNLVLQHNQIDLPPNWKKQLRGLDDAAMEGAPDCGSHQAQEASPSNACDWEQQNMELANSATRIRRGEVRGRKVFFSRWAIKWVLLRVI